MNILSVRPGHPEKKTLQTVVCQKRLEGFTTLTRHRQDTAFYGGRDILDRLGAHDTMASR